MPRMMLPNLPVADLQASVAFWKEVGFAFDERFGGGDAACLVVNDLASVMLLRADLFHGFHGTRPHTGTETLICLTAEDRAEVDELIGRAVAAGATELGERADEPPMYAGAFRDLDGHIWEVLWMEGA